MNEFVLNELRKCMKIIRKVPFRNCGPGNHKIEIGVRGNKWTNTKKFLILKFILEGRYLTCFEECILEHNFFTYEQIEKTLDRIEDIIREGAEREENRLGGRDAIQLAVFVDEMRCMMAESSDLKLISVLS